MVGGADSSSERLMTTLSRSAFGGLASMNSAKDRDSPGIVVTGCNGTTYTGRAHPVAAANREEGTIR